MATAPTNTTPTTFRSISGFALPSVIHNSQPLPKVSHSETSATALRGTTGIWITTSKSFQENWKTSIYLYPRDFGCCNTSGLHGADFVFPCFPSYFGWTTWISFIWGTLHGPSIRVATAAQGPQALCRPQPWAPHQEQCGPRGHRAEGHPDPHQERCGSRGHRAECHPDPHQELCAPWGHRGHHKLCRRGHVG